MREITQEDLNNLKKEIERIKKDPKAQERIRQKLLETKEILMEWEEKRRITPNDWQKVVTF